MGNLPEPIPTFATSLTQHALDKHRARIGVEVDAMLYSGYNRRVSDLVKQRVFSDWMDTLQDWPFEQIVFAMRDWRNENPSKNLNPGHILNHLKGLRSKAYFQGKYPLFHPKRDKEFLKITNSEDA